MSQYRSTRKQNHTKQTNVMVETAPQQRYKKKDCVNILCYYVTFISNISTFVQETLKIH